MVVQCPVELLPARSSVSLLASRFVSLQLLRRSFDQGDVEDRRLASKKIVLFLHNNKAESPMRFDATARDVVFLANVG